MATENEAVAAKLDDLFRRRASLDGQILTCVSEAVQRQTFRHEGATSTEAWLVERFGLATPVARALTHVGEKVPGLPHLIGALRAGDISFDKVRAVADVATRRTERQLAQEAREHSVRELAELARSLADRRAAGSPDRPDTRSGHDRRFLRFNDAFRTMTVQLPPESYAETRACIDARTATVPDDGETPLDQRRSDGFMDLVRSGLPGTGSTGSTGSTGQGGTASPYFVVAHVPLDALLNRPDGSRGSNTPDSSNNSPGPGEPTQLAGELERDGLIDTRTVQKIACDATIAVAVDDDSGYTMYEGRARRFPTSAQRREVMRRDRCCRFPGCTNVTFTNVHHIVPWKPGGRTDLDNLALMCLFHHGIVHRKGWTMTGNGNEELRVVGPSGRVMTSRPSPLWTRVTALR